jgi:hypothetical protein
MDYALPTVCALAHAAFLLSRYPGFVTRHEPISTEPLTLISTLPPLYLVGVFAGWQWMKRRKEFDPSAAMLVYNAYASVLSFVMLALFFSETVLRGINPFTAAVDHGPNVSTYVGPSGIVMRSSGPYCVNCVHQR